MKKTVILLICLALCVGCFAACKNQEQTGTTTEATNDNQPSNAATGETVEWEGEMDIVGDDELIDVADPTDETGELTDGTTGETIGDGTTETTTGSTDTTKPTTGSNDATDPTEDNSGEDPTTATEESWPRVNENGEIELPRIPADKD